MMKIAEKSGFRTWLKLVVGVIFPPVILLIMGTFFISHLNREAVLKKFGTQAAVKLEQMRLVANTEKYLCRQLKKIVDRAKNEVELKAFIEEFSRDHELKIDSLIWSGNGEVFHSSFKYTERDGDWKRGFLDLRDFAKRKYSSEAKIGLETYANLRTLFGPHFFPRYHQHCFEGNNVRLLRNDSSQNMPLLWLKVSKKFGLAVFFDYSVLDSYVGVNRMLRTHSNKGIYLAIINKDVVKSSDKRLASAVQKSSGLFRTSFKNILKLDNYYFVTNFIDANLTGTCFISAKEIDQINLAWWSWLSFMLGLLLAGFFLFNSYQIVVNKQRFSMMIRRQLIMLFIFSNLMPGFVLTMVSWDYIGQFRQGLLNQAYTKGISYLQSIDELYENELTVQKNLLERSFPQFEKDLKKYGICKKTMRTFLNSQEPKAYRMFLIGSNTPRLSSNEAIMTNGKVSTILDKNYHGSPNKLQQLQAFSKIGKFYLASLNREAISAKIGTEVEMLTETLSQQSPTQLMQEFITKNGKFWSWGFGHKRFPAYVNLFTLHRDDVYDYMMLYLWSSRGLQSHFMDRLYPKFSRNEMGYKVMAVYDSFTRAYPKRLLDSEKLREFSSRLRDKTVRRLDFCDWENEEYLLIGLKCVYMDHFRLLGLYPMESIENLVGKKINLLLGMALVSILVTLSLGMFVSRSVLEPLAELNSGIVALGAREFSYRLPDLGGDEFGNLAKIFNTTLVDLEEIHTAAKVKEKLMTPTESALSVGHFQIFGQTLPLSEMGGDFVEVQPINENSARVVLGDVAGSGISSTLILAFIKSALMQLDMHIAAPEKLVHELDNLLRVSSSKGHRKFVALQYLFLDGANNLVDFVNAGMFYPVILSESGGILQQVEMAASPLGAMVKSIRKSVQIELKKGEFLVLFTNGVLAGGRVKHSDVHELIMGSDFSSVEALHKSFCENFKAKFSGINLSDDVTIVVIKNVGDGEGSANANGTEHC